MGSSTCEIDENLRERKRERAHDMCNECVLIVMFSLLFCFVYLFYFFGCGGLSACHGFWEKSFGRDKTTFLPDPVRQRLLI